jgi:molybdopterin-containing oxidoreductase family iron-sulfur binding subunit
MNPTGSGATGNESPATTRRPRRSPLSRRRLLQLAGTAAAGTALGGLTLVGLSQADASAEAENDAEHQWAFVIDLRRCDGCEKCRKACQETHHLPEQQTWIKVYEQVSPTGQYYYMPRLCMHCAKPPCVRVCPVGATYANKEGVVLVNQNICIGCRACMAACPYEARYFNWEDPPKVPSLREQPMPEFPVPQQVGTVGKCILCVHYVDVGRLPACVEACTMGALYIADKKRDIAINSEGETLKLSKFLQDNDAVRFKEELGTEPRVYYILGHGQDLDF